VRFFRDATDTTERELRREGGRLRLARWPLAGRRRAAGATGRRRRRSGAL